MVSRDAVGTGAGQREQLTAWEAALVASGLPVAGLDAPKPKPRFAPAAPLAGGIPGEAELLDLWLVERLPCWRVREALLGVMPPAHRLVDIYDVWLGEPALPGRVAASVFRVALGPVPTAEAVRAAAHDLLGATSLPRERRKGDTVVAYDLRPFLGAIDVEDAAASGGGHHDGPTTLRMMLRHDPERGIGRPEELLAALSDRLGTQLEATGLVRERLVLDDPPPEPSPPPRKTGLRPGGRPHGEASRSRDTQPRGR